MFHVFTRFIFIVLGMFFGGADKPKKDDELVFETLNADPACFHICGESQEKVSLAKRKLQELINDQYYPVEIQDKAILILSKKDWRCITDIQRKLCVSISIRNTEEQLVLIISGHWSGVNKAKSEITAILQKATKKR